MCFVIARHEAELNIVSKINFPNEKLKYYTLKNNKTALTFNRKSIFKINYNAKKS